ncbi:MAG TPA: hypothetical protein VM487_07450 [Phycisphaerae bacterium]|nr:hypothetical protein [Phycisphaerae bacterium]
MAGLQQGGFNTSHLQPGRSYTPAPVSGPSFASQAGTFLNNNAGNFGALAGVGAGIAGSLYQAKALKARGKAEAAAAEYNARLAEIQGQREARRIRRTARQQLSRDYVQMTAKSGVTGASGGWIEVLAANAEEYERSAVEAIIAGRMTAALDRSRGAIAKQQAKKSAGAALLAGASKAAGSIGNLYGGGV